jgi:hypothetical protein
MSPGGVPSAPICGPAPNVFTFHKTSALLPAKPAANITR